MKLNIKMLRDPAYRNDQSNNNYHESVPYILAFHAGHTAATRGVEYKHASAAFTDDRIEAFNVGWDMGSLA